MTLDASDIQALGDKLGLTIMEPMGNSDFSAIGEQLRYIGATNEQVQWGSNDDPRGVLTEGQVYTLDHVEPHSWHCKVYLKEHPGLKFNSVHFETVDTACAAVKKEFPDVPKA